jgi:hypothetical protein
MTAGRMTRRSLLAAGAGAPAGALDHPQDGALNPAVG